MARVSRLPPVRGRRGSHAAQERGDRPRPPLVLPAQQLDRLRGPDVPLLLLPAGNSRTHDPSEAASRARELLPRVEVAALPDGSHHALPQGAPPEPGGRLAGFLTPSA
ncbi:hypothetical protein ACFQ9U_26415 [Streptomyces sp. NPDC056568]|uniref:hypothetical protein n=1 Tax=Streptomyces sp. NPDC056568 TaxID=3345866 RepID=UPI0036C508E8